MIIRPITPADRVWVAETIGIRVRVGAAHVARASDRGRVALDGYAAELDGRPVGCALLNGRRQRGRAGRLVTTYRGAGAGTRLLGAVVARAKETAGQRLWLVTGNDNTDAIRLYQRAGWDWVDFRRDAHHAARRSSGIPRTGNHGIPLRHEIEFESPL